MSRYRRQPIWNPLRPIRRMIMPPMRKVLVALSGGMDSTTMLHQNIVESKASEHPWETHAVGFDYGSKHSVWELDAARRVCEFFGVPFRTIDVRSVFSNFNSALLKTGPDVPEGHYEEENMRQTVVPGRNLIILSILGGFAESSGFTDLLIGAHAGDHYIYPDCRPEFLHHAMQAIFIGSSGRVVVRAPFLYDNKTSILKWGLPHETPYKLTRTCYTNNEVACGRCGSCQERLAAFKDNGVEDPIEYATRELLPKQSG